MPRKKALVATGNSMLTIMHALLSDPAARYWSAPSFPDSPSIRVEVWKGEVIASTEEELLTGIQG
jgi:hypothetical protein